jgi:membrane-bound acyltransferase YfiQ involved in biofilm formation
LAATAAGALQHSGINPYLNPLNWLGYFSLGVLAQRKLERGLLLLRRRAPLVVLSYVVLLILAFWAEPGEGGYFTNLAMPLQIAGIVCILAISTVSALDTPALHRLSELTFSIYLVHFLVLPFRRVLVHAPLFEFINPLAYLGIAAGLLALTWKLSALLRMDGAYATLLGIRRRQIDADPQ